LRDETKESNTTINKEEEREEFESKPCATWKTQIGEHGLVEIIELLSVLLNLQGLFLSLVIVKDKSRFDFSVGQDFCLCPSHEENRNRILSGTRTLGELFDCLWERLLRDDQACESSRGRVGSGLLEVLKFVVIQFELLSVNVQQVFELDDLEQSLGLYHAVREESNRFELKIESLFEANLKCVH